MIAYSIRAARRSGQSAIPVRIVYADYAMIGMHEQSRLSEVERLAQAMLSQGYDWPPIAVFQTGSDELFETADENQRLSLTMGDIGVADGHHRLAAVTQLGERGLLRDPYIPVQLIPAHDPSKIRNVASEQGKVALSLTEVEFRFRNPGNNYAPTSTHFRVILSNGQWVPVRESQPDLIISPEQLLQSVDSAR